MNCYPKNIAHVLTLIGIHKPCISGFADLARLKLENIYVLESFFEATVVVESSSITHMQQQKNEADAP